jgi:protein SCO1
MGILMRFVVLIIILTCLAGCKEKPLSEFVVHYKPAKSLGSFKLQDQYGNQVTEQQLHDGWTLIFLGYTSCPDICPMTLALLDKAHSSLKKDVDLNIWFISVDPTRDFAEKRKSYINYFNSKYMALSAEHSQLYPFTRMLGLMYAINNSDKDEYYVDHSASVVLINPNGQLEAIFKPQFIKGSPPLINIDTLIQDFKIITD